LRPSGTAPVQPCSGIHGQITASLYFHRALIFSALISEP
jgi:hypothetical protein